MGIFKSVGRKLKNCEIKLGYLNHLCSVLSSDTSLLRYIGQIEKKIIRDMFHNMFQFKSYMYMYIYVIK